MTVIKKSERADRAIAETLGLSIINGCRPLRGLFLFYLNDPGVSLRFTPGFMLSPRFAGSVQTFDQLVQTIL